MVTIIDYGIGNLRSMEKAVEKVGIPVQRTDDPAAVRKAERLVLPGVGAFGSCMAEIEKRNLVVPMKEAVEQGTPLLGVCVGLQLLFEEGRERGVHRGLGLLEGAVIHLRGECSGHDEENAGEVRASSNGSLKVPHMGWNTVVSIRDNPLLEGLPPEPYFYFVHSYRACPGNPSDVLGTTSYGEQFPAIVQRNNLFGVQFHPEKSQRNGLRLLRNFAQLPC